MIEWKTKRPNLEGEYLVVLETPVFDGEVLKFEREVATRYFGAADSWRMYGEPNDDCVWSEQTGSREMERVIAWCEIPEPPTEEELPSVKPENVIEKMKILDREKTFCKYRYESVE